MSGSLVSGHPSATDGTGATAQRERRTRILDATIALASHGGFEAVQMRAVAERADVALGTLYRYFPSKIHLLVSGLARELERGEADLRGRPVPGDTAADRVVAVLREATRRMQADPHLTEALTRAFMFADGTVQAESQAVGRLTSAMLTGAMHPAASPDDLTDTDAAVARVLADVWFSALVGWVTGRTGADDVVRQIDVAARLLLR